MLLVKNRGRTQIQAYVTLISKSVLFPLHILLAICWDWRLRARGAPSTEAAQTQVPYLLRPQFQLEIILINRSLTSQTKSLSKWWPYELPWLASSSAQLLYFRDLLLPENLGSRPTVVIAWSLPHKYTVTLSLHILWSLGSYLRVWVHVFIQIFMEKQL